MKLVARSLRGLLAPSLCALMLLSASGCDKKGAAGTNEPSPVDDAAKIVIDFLQAGDYDAMMKVAVPPLSEDLPRAMFDDIAKVLQWLGPVKDIHLEEDSSGAAAMQRIYWVSFENGEVEMEVTLLEEGKLLGFHFEGADFVAAEHGALEDRYTKFKVYDFLFLQNKKSDDPTSNRVSPGRIEYKILLGGLEAQEGEHHLSFEKIVLNSEGQEIYHEPIEFDLRFEENSEGIPRGDVKGFVQVDEPGSYTIDLIIYDNIADETLDFRQPFVVVSE